jgi:cardiolipin synthase
VTHVESQIAPSHWQTETLFNDGDAFFSAFENAIDEAKRSVHVETYIFDLDSLGRRILEKLASAAKRGVEVKVLMDGIGSSAWSNDDAKKMRAQGVQIQFFHPLFWQKSVRVFKIPDFRMMNHRDHRKLYVIDARIAFVGSMNISARHLKSACKTSAWRDTSVMLTGGPVSALQDSFWVSWTTALDRMFKHKRLLKRFFSKLKLPILLKYTLHQRRMYREELIARIEETKTSICITTPYFVPDREVLAALLAAPARGIRVRLLFPKVSDFFGVKYAMEGSYRKLLEANIEIYEYLPSMLHAKIMMLDDFISVGSSNLNHRSFFKDLEMDVVLNLPETRTLLQAQFEEDLSHSELRDLVTWKKRPFHRKLLERFFFLFRGVL